MWGDLISGGNQFFRMSKLYGSPFCIQILKVLWTRIPLHSLDFSPFCMNEEDFSQSPEISTNQRGGHNFWGNQFCRMSELLGSPFCFSILKVL